MDENAGRAQPWDAQQVMYQALISSALQSAQAARDLGMAAEQIILSCKVSGVQDLISVYRGFGCALRLPLASGFDRSRYGHKGTVASATALSILLQEGIGDTIRVSLTPQPGEARTQEVVVALEILQAFGLCALCAQRHGLPWCGRTTSTVFRNWPNKSTTFACSNACGVSAIPVWKSSNWPSWGASSTAQAKANADIGISLPGTGEAPAAPVFIDGERPDLARRAHLQKNSNKSLRTTSSVALVDPGLV